MDMYPLIMESAVGAAALGKQKPMAAAEGKNRRALGDIGNLVDARGAIEG